MKTLHIAVAQVHSGGGIDETLDRIETQMRAAAVVGSDLILFSESVLQGYGYGADLSCETLARDALTLDSAPCRRLVAMASAHDVAIVAGMLEADGNAVYNSCLVAYRDGRCAVQRKHQLAPAELAAGIVPGPRERTPVMVNGVKCAIVICSDSGIEGLGEMLRAADFDYRLCPTAGGGRMGEMLRECELDSDEARQRYLANRPRVFRQEGILDLSDGGGLGFASANALGPTGRSTCHQGHCMIVDGRGVMRAQIPGTIILEHQQDQIVHAELTFQENTP